MCPQCSVERHVTNQECDNGCGTFVCRPCGHQFHHFDGKILEGHNPNCGAEPENNLTTDVRLGASEFQTEPSAEKSIKEEKIKPLSEVFQSQLKREKMRINEKPHPKVFVTKGSKSSPAEKGVKEELEELKADREDLVLAKREIEFLRSQLKDEIEGRKKAQEEVGELKAKIKRFRRLLKLLKDQL